MPRRRELGRGERVISGLWRLRLPLPFPGVPHCNAWAVAADGGLVLFDTGMHEAGSMDELERAFAQIGLSVDDVALVVCTHAHADHWGQAATICDRTGCEMWMHPNHEHGFAHATDPETVLARRLEIGRQSGVPASALTRYAEEARGSPSGIARVLEPARELVDGVSVDTDLGTWTVLESPGHAPSHVCLFQPERRLLISGDHVLGRISLYFDYGWTPDPVGEFLGSLDVVDELDARLALSGHGKPFLDVHGHIEGNRRLVSERLDAVCATVASAPRTALEITPHLHDEPLTEANAGWWLPETLCYLTHLERLGRVRREPASEEGVERWTRGIV
jgi:glyoxylase-like metal-dependent hydrolase (beta-lactamase superfamily II)